MKQKQVNRRLRFAAIAAVAIGAAGLPLAAVAQQQPAAERSTNVQTPSPAGRSSDRDTNASDRSGERSSDRTSDTTADDKVNQQPAAQIVTRVVSAALEPEGGLNQLVECFYGPDRERFEQAMKNNRPADREALTQAIGRLQQSFRAKFNQPLVLADVSALDGGFIRVESQPREGARTAGSRIERRSDAAPSGDRDAGSGAGAGGEKSAAPARPTDGNEPASPAAERKSPDQSASGTTGPGAAGGGASSAGPSESTDKAGAAKPTQGNIAKRQDAAGGTSGSPTVGTRQRISEQVSGQGSEAAADSTRNSAAARTGGGVVLRPTTALIPAGDGLPAVVLSLVADGQEWKLNVPDTLTPQRLEENLVRELNAAAQQRAQWPADAHQAQQTIAHRIMMAVMDMNAAARPPVDQLNRAPAR